MAKRMERLAIDMVMPYLQFEGQCEEAFRFYREIFGGGELHMATYGDAPADPAHPLCDRQKGMVMHAFLQLTETGGISGADSLEPVQGGGNVSIHVHCPSVRAAEQAHAALASGGEVIGPVMSNPPPHDDGVSGAVRDRFGFAWILSGEKHAGQP